MEYRFPEGFVWGAATAALQVEGALDADGRGPSVWDVFCREHPERIFGGVTPAVACDHYHRFAEDVRLMKEFGLTGYRLSIAWPRLFPTGDGPLNEAGAAFYHRLFDALTAAGIEPHVTLFHWDLPQALAERGGWENPATVAAFVAYAQTCFRLFGDRVRRWATFNEPSWMILNGWLTGLHPPAWRDPAAAVRVSTAVLGAHARAVRAFREGGHLGAIGIVLNLSPVYPATERPEDATAAQRADGILNRWFRRPVLHGSFPEDIWALYEDCRIAPALTPDDRQALAEARPDFLGVNYYYPHHAVADAAETSFHLNITGDRREDCVFALAGLFRFVKNPTGRYTDWGWEIYPEGLYDLLKNINEERPDLPLFVTENGIGLADRVVDGRVDDQARIAFVREHLQAVHRAIAAGVPVRGYFLWSLLDNFSWLNGYRKRYGLFFVDRLTLRRIPKASAFWYREVARANGF
ncbi:MAG: Glycosyl hydrolase family 1 [Candidatus Ozemobacter sibiricus]|uniref:Beta-glucosidase n=1 Tax=Candidatus Ozemobacter sibiricus TaxID=2268124 RepID=A0A367ZIH8_9BACT|nr:MAG: Glycosyl hydrolase family 1 [Candidatus Ozemobacter sibiricus]